MKNTDDENKTVEGKRFKKRPQQKKPVRSDHTPNKSNTELECPSLGKPGNDFSWWNKIPELMKDAANLKANYVAGTPIADLDIPFIPTGVLKVDVQPCYGNSISPTDPVNVTFRDLYLRMFQKFRGITSYSASDLGIAILAANEATRLFAVYERIYGVINRYSKLNLNMPYTEQEALELSSATADYLRGHLSDFRYDLNLLIRKAQRLCILKDMSVIADNISLFAYEYLDHESTRAQIILFQPATYGVYSDTALTSGGSIQFKALAPDLFDFNADNMCKALNTALDALLGSDSIHKIFGDLVVWFGEESMLTMSPIPEDYMVVPIKDDTILHKLHNVETVGDSLGSFSPVVPTAMAAADKSLLLNGQYWVFQYNDSICTRITQCLSAGTKTSDTIGAYDYLLSNGGLPLRTNAHVLDTYRVEADPEVIVEGSLFKYHTTMRSSTNGSCIEFQSCAFFIPVKFDFYTLTVNGTVNKATWTNITNSSGNALAFGGIAACIDWAPLSYCVNAVSAIIEIYGDIDNVIPVYANDLARIHRTCVLSGLYSAARVKTN